MGGHGIHHMVRRHQGGGAEHSVVTGEKPRRVGTGPGQWVDVVGAWVHVVFSVHQETKLWLRVWR